MISAATLDAIAEAVKHTADTAILRQRFPGIAFSACSDDDVPARARPVGETGLYRLYLIGSANGHCIALTDDYEVARRPKNCHSPNA